MEVWYNAGLMDVTGHAYGNYWQFDRNANEPYPEYGNTLKRQCNTVTLPEDDYVTAFRVISGDHGVE